jgi:RNA polymerase sigma-70 factor (ECF subfamily)
MAFGTPIAFLSMAANIFAVSECRSRQASVASAVISFHELQVWRRFGFMETSCGTISGKDSDGALVVAAKRGEGQAFEELVLRYRQRVLAVAQRIMNNQEDAEDVAQESFHKAFLHLGSFQEKSRFSTWLTRIAMNEAFMLLRRRRGFFEILPESPDDGVATSPAFVDQTPNPEESCWRRERRKLLGEAINRLGPKIRITILLCYIEERSLQEAAQILGTSVAAVKTRVFHGRRKLRRTVNPRLLPRVYEAGQKVATASIRRSPKAA